MGCEKPFEALVQCVTPTVHPSILRHITGNNLLCHVGAERHVNNNICHLTSWLAGLVSGRLSVYCRSSLVTNLLLSNIGTWLVICRAVKVLLNYSQGSSIHSHRKRLQTFFQFSSLLKRRKCCKFDLTLSWNLNKFLHN